MSRRPQHRARRTRRGVGARPLLFAVGFLLACAAPALAFYVIDVTYTSDDGIAQANQLVAPGSPTASADNTSGTITVGWTAAAQASGVVPQYQVVRVSGPGSPTTVCTVPSDVTSCQDTGLTAGTPYDYSIRALLDDWRVCAGHGHRHHRLADPRHRPVDEHSRVRGLPSTSRPSPRRWRGRPIRPTRGTRRSPGRACPTAPRGVAPSYPSSSVTFYQRGGHSHGLDLHRGPGRQRHPDRHRRRCDHGDRLGRCHGQPARGGIVRRGYPVVAQRRCGVRRDDHRPRRLRQHRHRYTGDEAVTFGGPSNAPEGTAPTYPATVAFAAGVGTAPITLFDRPEHRAHRQPGHHHRQLGELHRQRWSGGLLRRGHPIVAQRTARRSTRRSPPSTPTATPPPPTPATRPSPSPAHRTHRRGPRRPTRRRWPSPRGWERRRSPSSTPRAPSSPPPRAPSPGARGASPSARERPPTGLHHRTRLVEQRNGVGRSTHGGGRRRLRQYGLFLLGPGRAGH